MKNEKWKMDKIIIRNLKVFGHHGLLPLEQERGQNFLIDIELSLDLQRVVLTDNIEDSVDYTRVIETVSGMVREERFKLLETLADKIAQAILSTYKVERVKVRVKKPELAMEESLEFVGVEIERLSRPHG